jgi:hypothetical protein
VFAIAIGEEFAPFENSYIEKIAVDSAPKFRAGASYTALRRTVIGQIARKVRAQQRDSTQSIFPTHKWHVCLHLCSTCQLLFEVRFGAPALAGPQTILDALFDGPS